MSLHLFVAHFPLALILLGAAADLVGAVFSNGRVRSWAGTLLMIGAAAAVLSFLSGARAMGVALSQPGADYELIAVHSQWGGAAVWPLAGAGVLRAIWRTRTSGIHGWGLLAASMISAFLIIQISLTGAAISHGM